MQSINTDTDFDFETLVTYPSLLTYPGFDFVTYIKQFLDNNTHSKVIFIT